MRHFLATMVVVGLVGAGTPCLGSSSSWLTLGVGSSVGVAHSTATTGVAQNSFLSELNLRLRMLKLFGVDLNYNMPGEKSIGTGETFASNFRLSALLFLVPTRWFSLYLSAGAGGTSLGDVFSSGLTGKSFHAGGGLEIYAGQHVAIAGEFLMVVPDVTRVVVSHQPLRVDEAGQLDWGETSSPSWSDYVGPQNYQFSFALRYYF